MHLERFDFRAAPEMALAHFNDHGFVLLRDIWTERELDAALEAGATLPTALDGTWDVCMNPHQHAPMFRALMHKPDLLRVLDRCAEGTVDCLQSQYMHGAPGYEGFGLHQDNHYIQTEPSAFVTAWSALERCDAENGGMVIFPGSHREPILPMGERPENSPDRRDITIERRNVQGIPDRYPRLELALERGDTMVFHGHLVHGSTRNRTAARFRRSFLFTYVRQGVSYRAGVGNKRQRMPRPTSSRDVIAELA